MAPAVIVCSPQMGLATGSSLGGEVYDVRLLQSLVELGVSFEVILPVADARRVEPSPGISLRPVRLRRARYSNAVFLREALRVHRNDGFDVLRVHTPIYVGPAGAAFRLLRPRVPVVYHQHHLDDGAAEKALTALIVRCADATVADSEFSRRQLVAQARADASKVHVVHPGVDAPKGGEPRIAEHHGIVGKQLIVTVGTLTARKNVASVVRLMPEVLLRAPCAHLVVVGDGPERAPLEQLVAALGLADSVLFTGYVPEERKAGWLGAAAVYVSLSTMEGFGLGVAEAQAGGVPAVVSARGSLPEVVLDGETGLVVDPSDEPQAVGALCALLSDPALRERLGAKARRRMARTFTWAAAAAGVKDVYASVLENRA